MADENREAFTHSEFVDPRRIGVKWASLAQAVRWVAFKVPPLQERFERLEERRVPIPSRTLTVSQLEDANYNAIAAAQYEIATCLMLGNILAVGNKNSTSNFFGEDKRNRMDWDFLDFNDGFSNIPSIHWHIEDIDWTASTITHFPPSDILDDNIKPARYRNVRILVTELFELFPPAELEMPNIANKGAKTQGKRGPRDKYDRADFFVICTLEANLNNLPATQAEFVRRMSELLSVIWGEDGTPGPWWLKKRFSELQNRQESYERARRELQGDGNTD